MESDKTILCVDDDVDNSEILKLFFEMEGYRVTICLTAEDCLDQARSGDFSAIVLDYHLPGHDGLEICRELREGNPRTPIVFFTADARETSREKGIEAGANDYLIKPQDLEKVVPIVGRLISESGS